MTVRGVVHVVEIAPGHTQRQAGVQHDQVEKAIKFGV